MTTSNTRTPAARAISEDFGDASINVRAAIAAADAFPVTSSSLADNGTRATAAANLAHLFRKLSRLYTGGETSSLSQLEATQLARSLEFTLGLQGDKADGALRSLACANPDELFSAKQRELARRVDAALEVWAQIVELTPPIRNVALRDTLASIGQLKTRYDTYFASHEVPCDIDYQLSRPIDPALEGVDYIEAYLSRLLAETRWIAQFTPKSCIAVLERTCPDYRGLHVNLCDLLIPHEEELRRVETFRADQG